MQDPSTREGSFSAKSGAWFVGTAGLTVSPSNLLFVDTRKYTLVVSNANVVLIYEFLSWLQNVC